MTNKKFAPIGGLNDLTEAEKLEYYYNACEYFKVPAELNLLQFIWIDNENGPGKNLVLYARKGATDIMRANNEISVDEVKETIGDGFIMFTAKGHDKTGRTDVAVGSIGTKGLSPRALSDAIMTAQTRATRRLTLQFVGGGLLDESEVFNTGGVINTTDVPAGIVGVAPISQPSIKPGRDITGASEHGNFSKELLDAGDRIIQRMAEPIKPLVAAAQQEPTSVLPQAPQIQPESQQPVSSAAPASEPLSTQSQAPTEKVKKPRKPRRTVSLETPGEERRELPRTEPLKTIEDITHQAIREHAVPQEGTVVPNPGTPTEAQLAARTALSKVPPPPPESDDDREIREAEERIAKLKAKKASTTPSEPVKVAPAPKPAEPEPVQQPLIQVVGAPNEEELKGFKARLYTYTNDILRKGNMKGSEGIGGVEFKMRAFIRLMFPQTPDSKGLTVNQWNALFGYLDSKLEEVGPEGLVKIINEKIGAKE